MGRARVHGGKRVGDRAARVVLRVDAQPRAGVGEHGPYDRLDVRGEHPAVGVAEDDDLGAGLVGGAYHLLRVRGIGVVAVEEVLAVDEDAAALRAQIRDGVADHREVLVQGGAQSQFHVPVVRLGDQADDRRLGLQQRRDLRVVLGPHARLAGRAERDEPRVLEVDLRARPLEELGVPRVRPRPAPLDEADAEVVQVAGDGQLVRDGEIDALTLRAVAQRGVEDVEGVVGCVLYVLHADVTPVGISVYRNDRLHRLPTPSAPIASGGVDAGKRKNLSRVREVCARVFETRFPRRTGVVRGGHCGPARLLPIIMANESTVGWWHSCPAPRRAVSPSGQKSALKRRAG